MSDITEGLGSAIEGGLVARAVEPRHGEGKDMPPANPDNSANASGTCLNCETPLVGEHCHACGQKRGLHRSLKTLGHDIMHGVLHLDGKLWRTLPLLLLKPGQLTRRYIEGERAKFVSPMAMFLFSVFLMFAVFQAVGISTPTDLDPASATAEQLASAKISTGEDREKLEAELEALPAGSAQAEAVQAELDDLSRAEAFLEGATTLAGEEPGEDSSPNRFEFEETGIDWLDTGVVAKWRENPSLMLYKMQTNAYKFSWLLIPISVPLVWSLFFWRRRFKAYDHAIFVTYSLAFMSLLFIVLSVLGLIGVSSGWLVAAVILIPPMHIYRHLRGTYELGRWGAIGRTVALLAMIVFGVSFLFIWILLALGAF